ncbi:MAG: glycosyltransferase family 39 protein [Anaerolineae bacterium]|nr:glycosyltransferase family 39 protein [Candidatus Roseilinea sp.]MDW8450302.1 glycosyltransferase family 39 protein [Anaerolineae bacterium]
MRGRGIAISLSGKINADAFRFARIVSGAAAVGLGALAYELAGPGEVAKHPVASLLAWGASIALALIAVAPLPPSTASPWHAPALFARARWIEWAGVAALFASAFALRAVQNDAIPIAWPGDEGSAGLAAVRIMRGELTNMFGVGWYSFPALFFAIPAVPISLLGQTYGALRLPAAFAGALTVVGLYGWMRSAFGWRVGLAAGLMLACSHYAIHWSRIGLNNIWDGTFIVFVGGLLWRGWRTGERWAYIGAGLLVGLSQYFYTGSRVLPVIIACWLLSMLAFERDRLARQTANLAAMAFIAFVVFLPSGLYFRAHPDQFQAPAVRVSLLRPDWPERGSNWFQYMARTTGRSVPEVMIGNLRDAALGLVWLPLRSWYAEAGKPVLLLAPAALALFGLGWLLVDFRNPNARYLLLVLAATIGIAAISESTPAGQRYVAGVIVAAACVGLGFALLGRLMADLLRLPNRYGYLLAVCALIAGCIADLNFYFREFAPVASRGDPNTQIATEVARRISAYPAGSQLYFFGAPRMTYQGFSTIKFVAPHVEGTDVLEPLAAPPDWTLDRPVTAFAFTPERATELEFVKRRYPNGRGVWIETPAREPLVLIYEVVLR